MARRAPAALLAFALGLALARPLLAEDPDRLLAELGPVLREAAAQPEPVTAIFTRLAGFRDFSVSGGELRTLLAKAGVGDNPLLSQLLGNVKTLSKKGDRLTLDNAAPRSIPLVVNGETKGVVHLAQTASLRVHTRAARSGRTEGTIDEVEGIELSESADSMRGSLKKIELTHRDGKPVMDVVAGWGFFSKTKTVDLSAVKPRTEAAPTLPEKPAEKPTEGLISNLERSGVAPRSELEKRTTPTAARQTKPRTTKPASTTSGETDRPPQGKPETRTATPPGDGLPLPPVREPTRSAPTETTPPAPTPGATAPLPEPTPSAQIAPRSDAAPVASIAATATSPARRREPEPVRHGAQPYYPPFPMPSLPSIDAFTKPATTSDTTATNTAPATEKQPDDSKVPVAVKVEAVLAAVGGKNPEAVARAAGLSWNKLQRMGRTFLAAGRDAVVAGGGDLAPVDTAGVQVSEADRVFAAVHVLAGTPAETEAERLGVRVEAVRAWRDRFLRAGTEAVVKAETP